MATELKKFSEAYAMLSVAVYEPLILNWVSVQTLGTLADVLAWRGQKGKNIKVRDGVTTLEALKSATLNLRIARSKEISTNKPKNKGENPNAIDNTGRLIDKQDIAKLDFKDLPNAVSIGNRTYPFGVLNFQPTGKETKGNAGFGVRSLPAFLSGNIGSVDVDFDLQNKRAESFQELRKAVQTAFDNKTDANELLRNALKKCGLYDFFPVKKIEEGLSPIGVAHFYRQMYFNKEEGCGPIEEAFTIAPLETLEVMYETVRRQIHEEILELGSEESSESAVETKNTEELSDKVSTMMQRDSSAAMSVNGSYSTGVWSAGASASADLSTSSSRSREEATRRLKEVTKRASERITKTFSLTTKTTDDLTTTNLTRRVIKNEQSSPVSYGLRRVLRRVHVKVQDLGPSLVWQLYIRNPGSGLATSHFVHFRDTGPIAVPDVPPGLPPRPKGGTDTGATTAQIEGSDPFFITVVIQPGKDRVVTAVSIDSITDLEGGGKDDEVAVPLNNNQFLPTGMDSSWDEATNTFTVCVAVRLGDTYSVSISYSYVWEPSQAIIDDWENLRKQKVAELTQKELNEKFEREKALITEKSKIRGRPASDLRREERYEVMSRIVSHLFSRQDDPSEPTPVEIEYFHRYFDIEAMFTYTHPSWWKPRYTPVASGLHRPSYEITADSEPAPMGSSLGWMIQLDGDARRNEFLNSPWVRVCLPIKSGRERESIEWLAKHIEGEIGYNVNASPLKDMLQKIEQIRNDQSVIGVGGPDFLTVDSGVTDTPIESEPLRPENIYPIIGEFDVTVPTDGFVYDELKLITI